MKQRTKPRTPLYFLFPSPPLLRLEKKTMVACETWRGALCYACSMACHCASYNAFTFSPTREFITTTTTNHIMLLFPSSSFFVLSPRRQVPIVHPSICVLPQVPAIAVAVAFAVVVSSFFWLYFVVLIQNGNPYNAYKSYGLYGFAIPIIFYFYLVCLIINYYLNLFIYLNIILKFCCYFFVG